MKKRFGWILMLLASLTSVSAFADEAREEEQKKPDTQQEEVAVVDEVQEEPCADCVDTGDS